MCTFYASPLLSANPREVLDLSLSLPNSKSDMLSAAAAKKARTSTRGDDEPAGPTVNS